MVHCIVKELNCTCCSVYLLSCLPHLVNRKPIFMGALYIVTYFQEKEKGSSIPTKLHVDSGNFDQSVALTQSELSESSISTVRWCVCICHFVGLAVSLLNDKHALTLSFSEHLLNRIPLKEEV